jgi:predicted RNase H-like nuclease (RuvC/YqgF family)
MYQPTQEHRGHFDLPDKTRFDLQDAITVNTAKVIEYTAKNAKMKDLRHGCTNYDSVVKDIERGAFPFLSPRQHPNAIDCVWAQANFRIREVQLDQKKEKLKTVSQQKNDALDQVKHAHRRLENRDEEYAALYREYEKVKMQRNSYARSNGQLKRRNREWKLEVEKRDRTIDRLLKKLANLTK